MPPTSDIAEPEIVPGGSAAENLVAQGATLMRIENDSMLAVAVQRPRNEANVLKGAFAELGLVPEEASKAYYSIPYKDRQMDGSVKITKVEGPSINAAMALARRWGNCSATSRVVNEDATGFDIEGVFIDMESNFRVSRPFRVGKMAKRRGGGSYLLDAQRLLVAVQAGASKAMRNAILSGLPVYLVKGYYNRAREIAAGNLDAKADPKKLAGVLKAFERFKVTKEMLERYTEEPAAEWTGETLAGLIGLGNALVDGQLTVAELFPPAEPEAGATQAPAENATGASTVTPDSLMGGTTTGQNGAAPAPRAAAAAPPSTSPGTVHDEAWEAAHCKVHGPTMTVVQSDGSKACDVRGCKWTAPPAGRVVGEDDDDQAAGPDLFSGKPGTPPKSGKK